MEGTLQDWMILWAYYLAICFFVFTLMEINTYSWKRSEGSGPIWFVMAIWPLIFIILIPMIVGSAPQYFAEYLIKVNDRIKKKGQSHE